MDQQRLAPTCLTAIGGWAETMQRAQMDPEELMEATDTILFESRRVLALSHKVWLSNSECPQSGCHA